MTNTTTRTTDETSSEEQLTPKPASLKALARQLNLFELEMMRLVKGMVIHGHHRSIRSDPLACRRWD